MYVGCDGVVVAVVLVAVTVAVTVAVLIDDDVVAVVEYELHREMAESSILSLFEVAELNFGQ